MICERVVYIFAMNQYQAKIMQETVFVERLPTTAEYNALKETAGWPVLDDEPTTTGLNNSLYAVCAMYKGEVVGTGRIIGDGGIYFHLQDVIVDPRFQGRGIGTGIVQRLMTYIADKACSNAMVGLMCAKGVDPLYQKFGFITRPNEKYGPGMCLVLQA